MNNVIQVHSISPEEFSDLLRDQIDQAINVSVSTEEDKLFEQVEYYTANQTAKICGFSVDTLRRKVREGLIKPTKRSVREKFHKSEILRYLKAWEDARTPFK